MYDKVFVSSDEVHALEFTLAAYTNFVQSPSNPTIFDADVAYLVRSGAMWLRDPVTGQTLHAEEGDIVWIKPRTWHQAFNPNSESVSVFEFFSPPPSQGTASVFALQQPFLESTQTVLWADESWPPNAQHDPQALGLVKLPRHNWRWSFSVETASTRVATVLKTEDLTIEFVEIDPEGLFSRTKLHADSILLSESSLRATTQLFGEVGDFDVEESNALFLPKDTALETRSATLEPSGSTSFWLATGVPPAMNLPQ